MRDEYEFEGDDLLGDAAEDPPYATALPHSRQPVRAGQITPRWDNSGPPPAPTADIGPARQRIRYIKPIIPFWTRLTVPFTGVSNQQVTNNSKPIDFDTWVLGGWTDLTLARAQFNVTRTRKDWSNENIPLLSVVGASDKVLPIRWWKQQVFLGAQDVIQGQFLNVGAENAGQICYMTHAYQNSDAQETVSVMRSMVYWMQIDLGNTALVSFSSPINDPVLIWGMSTNADNDVTVVFTDDRSNYSWSSDQLPVRAFAGVDAEVQPIASYPRPYFLGGRARMRANYNTAVTGNYVSLICERLFEYKVYSGLEWKQFQEQKRKQAK